ncbi:DUF2515 family protein [Bacillus sp. FJAT-45350]|uniref:DUF2515 family protein n=1 Tax=Bacillus sp. FJAT-45350 TaxID=2011014 RepID=UPI000BB8F520|nr:DUF2515 family protein [Bacillus sp. FJAT-45350]
MLGTCPSEKKLINYISRIVRRGNIDNISRTVFYQSFFKRHNEIQWALLASFVSRNAGWSMTDLESNWFRRMIPRNFRNELFMTYERANWLIFSDAFPQLLIYEASKKYNVPFFHLLKEFHVSQFMVKEWENFWKFQGLERLRTALIINEQNLIQKPVIEHHHYQKVFHSVPYNIQEQMHLSNVIFPTLAGKLYGFYVEDFIKIKKRIDLGKRLAWLLFHSKESGQFHQFLSKVTHTGSRRDYEKYVKWSTKKTSPILRMIFPSIHHERHQLEDWSEKVDEHVVNDYFTPIKETKDYEMTTNVLLKQKELYVSMRIEEFLLPKKLFDEEKI